MPFFSKILYEIEVFCTLKSITSNIKTFQKQNKLGSPEICKQTLTFLHCCIFVAFWVDCHCALFMDLDRSNSLIKFLQNYSSTVHKAATYTSLFFHGTFAKTLTLSEKFNSSKIFCGWLQSPFQHGACKCRQLDLSQFTVRHSFL